MTIRKEIIGGATLLLGDCREILPTLERVDAVLSDLPYGTTRCSWDSHIELEFLWGQYSRLCDGGPVILFAQTPFDKTLGASNIDNLRYEWIWEKTHPTGHLNSAHAPLKAHENVLVFCSKTAPYFPIKTSGHARKTATKRGDLTPLYGGQTSSAIHYDSDERLPRSVLLFASDKQHEAMHPTQKPVALCEYLLQTHTAPDDLVLDNCMGSGTTGVACVRLGRQFIGIEVEKKFFDIACRRIEAATRQPDLFIAPPAPKPQQLSLMEPAE